MTPKKILLCRTRGGLNDTLCQIKKCWDYSEKFNRTLVIDSIYANTGLRDNFLNYFHGKDPKDHFVTYDKNAWYKELDFYPEFIREIIDDYQVLFDPVNQCHLEKKSRKLLSFDFSKDYQEGVLVHDQSGGGSASLDCLRRLRLNPEIKSKIKEKIDLLEKPYIGIHIRNTDLETDFESFFKTIKKEVENKNILVCSDNIKCIHYAKKYFKHSNVMSVSNIPDLKGQPLHRLNKLNPYECNLNSLIDLFALAKSENVLITKHSMGSISGFSMLALKLNENPEVLAGLFS